MNYLLVNDTTTQNNWGCHSTTAEFRNFFESEGFLERYSISLEDMYDIAKIKSKLNSFDINEVKYVLINGEGSIYDSQKKGMNMLKLISHLKINHPELTILFLNSTFDLNSWRMRRLFKKITNSVDLFCAREPVSLNNLKKIGVKNCIIQPDFLYSRADLKFSDHEDYIVVGGNSNYYRNDRPRYDAMSAYRKLVRRLLEEGNEVKIYSSDLADIQYLGEVSNEFGLEHITCVDTKWDEALQILSRAKLSISGRYHPSIMSLCGHTPCYFISANNCKMIGTSQFFYPDEQSFSNSHELDNDVEKIVTWSNKAKENYPEMVNSIKSGLISVKSQLDAAKEQILFTMS